MLSEIGVPRSALVCAQEGTLPIVLNRERESTSLRALFGALLRAHPDFWVWNFLVGVRVAPLQRKPTDTYASKTRRYTKARAHLRKTETFDAS